MSDVETSPMNSRRPRYRRPIALLALAVSVIALTSAGQATAAGGRTATAHGPNGRLVANPYHVVPKRFNINHPAGEPTIGITRQGYVTITAGSGCLTSCAGSTERICSK